jgi:hypothetical protein
VVDKPLISIEKSPNSQLELTDSGLQLRFRQVVHNMFLAGMARCVAFISTHYFLISTNDIEAASEKTSCPQMHFSSLKL